MKKRILCGILAALMVVGIMSGCEKVDDGKIKVSVGEWPTKEASPDWYESIMQDEAKFEETYPEYDIVPDTYQHDIQTYQMKAAAGQLPNVFTMAMTEIKSSIENEYVADLTKVVKEFGYDKKINPQLMDLCTSDGKIYALPKSGYNLGLMVNKKIFKEAGLVNADGSVKIPRTWQDVAEFSQIIKEKTGVAGFCFPTTQNQGGWVFLNIAWGFGAELMVQDEEGKWQANLNSKETKDAVQYLYDLQWKYNAFPDEVAIDNTTMYQIFGTYRAGMLIANPPAQTLFISYEMDPADVMCVSMPAGPAGRFSQVGGTVYMMGGNATEEQQRGVLMWLDFTGTYTPKVSDVVRNQKVSESKLTIEQRGIVLPKQSFPIWTDEESIKFMDEIYAEYANVALDDYIDFFNPPEDLQLKAEYPRCSQEMYAVIDKVVQEIRVNKNINIDELMEEANNELQANHLDKIDYINT